MVGDDGQDGDIVDAGVAIGGTGVVSLRAARFMSQLQEHSPTAFDACGGVGSDR